MNVTLNPKRIGILMRHDIQSNLKSLVSALSIIVVITVVFSVVASWTANAPDELQQLGAPLFIIILTIGGIILSSVAFTRMHNATDGIHYLMLPGSTEEKYVSRLLLTSIGWTAAALIVYTLSTALAAAITVPIFGRSPGVFLPAGREVWRAIASYLVTQSVFLFGSIYFRKTAFFKTVLTGFVISVALMLFWTLAGRIIFAEAFADGATFENFEESFVWGVQAEALGEALTAVSRILGWVVTPLFFWTTGLLRLRETEV